MWAWRFSHWQSFSQCTSQASNLHFLKPGQPLGFPGEKESEFRAVLVDSGVNQIVKHIARTSCLNVPIHRLESNSAFGHWQTPPPLCKCNLLRYRALWPVSITNNASQMRHPEEIRTASSQLILSHSQEIPDDDVQRTKRRGVTGPSLKGDCYFAKATRQFFTPRQVIYRNSQATRLWNHM